MVWSDSPEAPLSPFEMLHDAVRRLTVWLMIVIGVNVTVALAAGAFVVFHERWFGGAGMRAQNGSPGWIGSRAKPGPWGELEYTEIKLTPPVEYLKTGAQGNSSEIRWCWSQVDRPRVESLVKGLNYPTQKPLELRYYRRKDL